MIAGPFKLTGVGGGGGIKQQSLIYIWANFFALIYEFS
jgi:hypothetical protein